MASWISFEFSVSAVGVRGLDLRDAKGREIVIAARQANAIIITNDNAPSVMDRLLDPGI